RSPAEAIAAIDVCVVPTLTFEQLFAFLVLGHGRRQLLWFAVTRNPTAEWLAQQRSGVPVEHGAHLPSEDRQEQDPSSLLYFKSEPSGEGWPTRAGERPAPWTLPQNLIDEARVLADGRIPLPEPERVPWDVLIAQAVNWDIPERLAA